MISRNKSAQSNVVIIVLVILIIIVALIIFWNFFNPFFKEKSREIKIDAFENEFEVKEANLFVTGASKVNVYRKSGNISVDELKFVFEDETGKTHVEIINDSIPRLMETEGYFFSPINNFGKIKKITVYPVIEGKEGIGSSIEAENIFNIPAGLVGWWKFDENLEDSIGGNRGYINGDVKYVFDENRKSVNFISGFINFGNDSTLNLNKEFAIAFWIKTNSKVSEILRKGESSLNYQVGIDENGKAKFSYSKSGIINSRETQNIVGDGKWHHLVITNMGIYLDGNLDKITNLDGNLDINNENLVMGNGFEGYVDDLMIFNRSLDKIQANSIFNIFR